MGAADTKTMVAGTATLIFANAQTSRTASEESAVRLLAKNVTGSAIIYIGGDASVTSTTGYPWDPAVEGPLLEDVLEPSEALYGILATGAAAQVLRTFVSGR